jgi:hypothetical protein
VIAYCDVSSFECGRPSESATADGHEYDTVLVAESARIPRHCGAGLRRITTADYLPFAACERHRLVTRRSAFRVRPAGAVVAGLADGVSPAGERHLVWRGSWPWRAAGRNERVVLRGR